MNTLTFGMAQDKNQFLIEFTYYAHGKYYSGTCTSPVPIGKGETFSVCYNPLDPQQNSKSSGSSAALQSPLLAVGIAGSILLSLLYLALIHGCG